MASKQNKQSNWSLVLAFLIPFLMILVSVGLIYLPRLKANPTQKFLYSSDRYYYEYEFRVQGGKLEKLEKNSKLRPVNLEVKQPEPQLYVYDPVDGSNGLVSFEKAQEFELSDLAKSDEGYELESGSGGGFLFFYSSRGREWFLKRGTVSVPIDLEARVDYSQPHLIGWVRE